MKKCSDCESYVGIGEGKNGKNETVQVGNCFRYPPTITVSGGSAYPVVGAAERACREFKLKSRGKAN